MRRVALFLAASAVVVSAAGSWAQQADSLASTNNPPEVSQSVPPLIMFSGAVKDLTGKPLTGPVDFNFAIYREQADAAPLWQESQTLNVDEQGHYTALLGAMRPEGLPVDLFTSGEARWLGVSVANPSASSGQVLPEQPRVLLVSVPYALKANDAEMLAGKPASAYALAQPALSSLLGKEGSGVADRLHGELATPGKGKSGPKPNVTGTGTLNYIPRWTDSAGTLGNSVIFQSGNNIGFGTTTPGYRLDVVGGSARVTNPSGTTQLVVSGSASSGRLGQDAAGFFFSSDTNAGALRFLTNNGSLHEWMRVTSGGNIGIGTTTPAHALDVAGDINASTNLNAGGNLSVTGTITGNGSGLTSVNAATLGGFAASAFQPAGSYATLGANTLTATQTISSGDVSLTNGNLDLPATAGTGTAGVITLGGNPFAHAYGDTNTFVGQSAGNFGMTGGWNAASGSGALSNNTTGGSNTASGAQALNSNTTGSSNTAIGDQALFCNVTGSNNTAIGYQALAYYGFGTGGDCWGWSGNTAVGSGAGEGGGDPGPWHHSGDSNTFIGAGSGTGTPYSINNATAIGAGAQVSASNALVLGAVGVNVGIGTGTPAHVLDVVGDINASSNITTGGVFTGNGSGLTNVTASTATNTLTLGSVPAANFARLDIGNRFTGAQTVTGGSVGIGTTSPAYLLDVVGGAARIANPSGTTQLHVSGSATSGRLGQDVNGFFFSSDTNGGAVRFLTNNGSLNEWMRVTSAGLVGIGTTTPTTTLQVAGGDVSTTKAGSGVIVKSPDGTKCARIGIDNTGSLSATVVACP